MKALQFKHKFTILNGKFIWDDEEMFKYKKLSLEGRRGYAIIEELSEDISPNQYAYYFGGIIRRECMVSNTFSGLTEMEIHQILFAELRSHTVGINNLDGTVTLKTVVEDFSAYKKKDMARYIEELIPHLNITYNIYPKPAEHYKDSKFFMKTVIQR